ncbi:MAG: DPP IV N-terminal domain-containing protein [Pirellulales bacterium]
MCNPIYFTILVLLTASPLLAQETHTPNSTPPLTIESIFKSGRFSTKSFSPNWETSGSKYVTNRDSKTIPNSVDLIAVDPVTHDETVLIRADQLIPTGAKKPLSIASHQWARNREIALIFTNTRKVWRHHSRGDYWLMDCKSGALRQIGADRPATSLMFAKISPDANSVAYVSEGDVYVESIATGITQKVTSKRTSEIINGTSDWVYEEEFDLKDCFRWSPDSQRIAFWEFDTSKVGEFTLINNTDSLYPTLKKFKHTKPGQTNSAVRIGIVDLKTHDTLWLDVPGDPRENYIARARWINNNELRLQHLNRKQNQNRVLIGDASTGKTKVLFTDSDNAWVETCDHDVEFDGGKQILWVSEKDGFRHVYGVNRMSGKMTPIMNDPFDAFQLVRVTDEQIYFIAAPDHPTDRYLYSVPLAGGKSKRVTPNEFSGWNSYDISPDGKIAFHTHSRFGQPPTTQLIELPTHQITRKIISNEKARTEISKLPPVESEFTRVNANDGTPLDVWIMKPKDFDPALKYPMIVYVYGEPWGTTVTNQWGGNRYLWHRLLAEQGYVVCSIDNRGTNVPRGRDFRKTVYRRVGILPPADQATAVKALALKYPWIDRQRIGVWGWSGGGSMTLNAMFKHPDLYHTGVSIAPVPNMLYYDSIYQERYMDVPVDNPDGYREGSPIHFAKNLTGNLLVIHGTGDDNCHYQTVELLINELVKQDRQFSMMAYPNRSHSINEGENTTVHLQNLITNFFLNQMPPGPK